MALTLFPIEETGTARLGYSLQTPCGVDRSPPGSERRDIVGSNSNALNCTGDLKSVIKVKTPQVAKFLFKVKKNRRLIKKNIL